MTKDRQDRTARSFDPADDFVECRNEAGRFALLWLIQSVFMISSFLLLGYGRTEDPFGFVWGMPAWFLVGVLGGSIVFLVISIVMALRIKEVSL